MLCNILFMIEIHLINELSAWIIFQSGNHMFRQYKNVWFLFHAIIYYLPINSYIH